MTLECLLPTSNAPATLFEMFSCVGQFLFASHELAIFFLFVLILFMLWVNKIPIQAAIPLGIGMFVAFSFVDIFSSMALITLLIVAVLTAWAFFKHFVKGGAM